MKRFCLGFLIGVLVFSAGLAFAQDNSNWNSWYNRNAEYIGYTNRAVNKILLMFLSFSQAMQEAGSISENSIAEGIRSQAIINSRNETVTIGDWLTMLDPPVELRVYQQGVIDAYDQLRDFLGKASAQNQELAIPASCIEALKKPLKEIALVYIRQGAPKEIVESRNKLVEEVAEISFQR